MTGTRMCRVLWTERPAGHGKVDQSLGVAAHQDNSQGWRRRTDLWGVM
jgi:hypothetical protein